MTGSRSRIIALLLGVVAVLVMLQYVRVWNAIPADQARTSDFAGTYAAASLWRTGQGATMYDAAAQQRILAATGSPLNHLDIPFENPPGAAVLASPLSLLDPATAYRAWSLLQLALVLGAAFIASRAAPWPSRTDPWVRAVVPLAAAAGLGTGLLFIEGQWDGFAVIGLALAYAGWRRGRSFGSGFAVGMTSALAKPHLAIGVAAFMLGRRDWRGLAGAIAGGGAMIGFSLVTVGPGGIAAFVHALLQPANSPVLYMQGAVGFAASWLGSGAPGFIAGLALSAAAAVAAGALGARARRFPEALEPALFGAVALSLLASPHLLGHDLTLLVPAFVAALAWICAREAGAGVAWPGRGTLALLVAWVGLSLATQRDLGNPTPAPPGRITPIALVLLAALAAVLASRWSSVPREAHAPTRGAAAA